MIMSPRLLAVSLLSLFVVVSGPVAVSAQTDQSEQERRLDTFITNYVEATKSIKGFVRMGERTQELPHDGPRHLSRDTHRICLVSSTYPDGLDYFSDLEKILYFATNLKTTITVSNKFIQCSQFSTIFIQHSFDEVTDEEVFEMFETLRRVPVPNTVINAISLDPAMRNDIVLLPLHPFTKAIGTAHYKQQTNGTYPHAMLLHLLMQALTSSAPFESGEERLSLLDASVTEQIASGAYDDLPHGFCFGDILLLQMLSSVPESAEISAESYLEAIKSDNGAMINQVIEMMSSQPFLQFFDHDC